MSALGLRSESAAANQHDAIKAFVQGTIAEAAPVVPISAQLKYNIDAVCEYIVKKVGLFNGMESTGACDGLAARGHACGKRAQRHVLHMELCVFAGARRHALA